MQFLYGDRELLLGVQDLLKAPVEVIVNPANSELTHPGGIAAQILAQAGQQLQTETEQLIREYGQIDSGMAVFTSAGQLPFRAVIHAVGPQMGEGNEQYKLEQAVLRSLQLCELNEWRSVAFPAISTGFFNMPAEICAQALFRSITHFWDARHECVLEKVVLCLTERNFQPFFNAFREEGFEAEPLPEQSMGEPTESVGEFDLSDEDISALGGDDIDNWFK